MHSGHFLSNQIRVLCLDYLERRLNDENSNDGEDADSADHNNNGEVEIIEDEDHDSGASNYDGVPQLFNGGLGSANPAALTIDQEEEERKIKVTLLSIKQKYIHRENERNFWSHLISGCCR